MAHEHRQTALVTGASSGIGAELARCFANGGWDLVLVSRRAEALESLARSLQSSGPTRCKAYAFDLSDPGAPASIEAALRHDGWAIDALVNNAGVGSFGPFTSSDLAMQLRLLQVNVVTLTELTHRLLPPMVQRRSGHILNVASTAAFHPGPLMAVYYASKAYVLSLGHALAEELRGTGVTVTTLCPGPTRTEFQEVARMQGSRLVHGRRLARAEDVARAGYAAMMSGRRAVVPGFGNWLQAESSRIAPRAWSARVVRWMQEPTGE